MSGEAGIVILPSDLSPAEERSWLALAVVQFERGNTGKNTAAQQAADMRLTAMRLIHPDDYADTRHIKKRRHRAAALCVTENMLRVYERMHPREKVKQT